MRNGAKSWLLTGALLCTLAAWRYALTAPRAWQPAETPVAWWTWRNRAPAAGELRAAAEQVGLQALFLRAGQLDRTPAGLRRIRAVTGALPGECELHLVYNATRAVLGDFARLEPAELANAIADSYAEDVTRASQDGATVAGVQLDLDVPSRALPRYEQLLRELRGRLPAGTQLSITGLETWLALPELTPVLAATDFWIPQCYGAAIPRQLSRRIPIATSAQTARLVAAARALNHPFYAGLAAYGYAASYAADGRLLELRGDLDPARVAESPELALIERAPFDPPSGFQPGQRAALASEWRYVYRARHDCVIDGLVICAGEALLLDLPTSASLRESARAARAEGGELLRGLCLFRLPGRDDATTLTLNEIAAALAADEAPMNFELAATQALDLALTVTNRGVSSLLGEGAFTLWLEVPPGSFDNVTALAGFSRCETFCGESVLVQYAEQPPQPCSPRRANLLRLTSHHLRGGEGLRLEFAPAQPLPAKLRAQYEFHADDGRQSRGWQVLNVVTTPEQKEERSP